MTKPTPPDHTPTLSQVQQSTKRPPCHTRQAAQTFIPWASPRARTLHAHHRPTASGIQGNNYAPADYYLLSRRKLIFYKSTLHRSRFVELHIPPTSKTQLPRRNREKPTRCPSTIVSHFRPRHRCCETSHFVHQKGEIDHYFWRPLMVYTNTCLGVRAWHLYKWGLFVNMIGLRSRLVIKEFIASGSVSFSRNLVDGAWIVCIKGSIRLRSSKFVVKRLNEAARLTSFLPRMAMPPPTSHQPPHQNRWEQPTLPNRPIRPIATLCI